MLYSCQEFTVVRSRLIRRFCTVPARGRYMALEESIDNLDSTLRVQNQTNAALVDALQTLIQQQQYRDQQTSAALQNFAQQSDQGNKQASQALQQLASQSNQIESSAQVF